MGNKLAFVNRGDVKAAVSAVIALVAATILIIKLQPEQPKLAGDAGYQKQSASYRAGGADCEVEKINSIPIGKRQAKADACAEAQEQHREATDSIIESRRSAISAEASATYAADQARIYAWSAGIGLLTLFAAIAAAFFAKKAAEHTEAGAKASAAMIRPHIAIEKPTIEFDETLQPTIRLSTHNVSAFTAHKWEWQPLLKYRVCGSTEERKSRVGPWLPHARGIDLAPGDHGPRIPKTLTFSVNELPGDDIKAFKAGKGLQMELIVFTRCYDALGNAVDDKQHFVAIGFNIAGAGAGYKIPFERVPAGTQVEAQEDKVPE